MNKTCIVGALLSGVSVTIGILAMALTVSGFRLEKNSHYKGGKLY